MTHLLRLQKSGVGPDTRSTQSLGVGAQVKAEQPLVQGPREAAAVLQVVRARVAAEAPPHIVALCGSFTSLVSAMATKQVMTSVKRYPI